jgi:uncharacterized protein (DUF1697 family)
MQTFIALLRGINVGGHHKLPMADLRELCEANGLKDSKTYIQSGNVVFRSGDKKEKISENLSALISERFGFAPRIVIREVDELLAAEKAFPYDTSNHKLAHIVFLDDKPLPEAISQLLELDFSPDEISVVESDVHCYFPNGVLETNIDFKKMERILGIAGTARNWRTVQKVIEMAKELET